MTEGLILLFHRLKGLLPSELPRTIPEFDLFFESICETYNIPKLPSYKHAVASMIMHLGPLETHKAKHFFVKSIRKAQANEISYAIIQDVKKQEAEAQKKAHEDAKINSEATIPSEPPSALQ